MVKHRPEQFARSVVEERYSGIEVVVQTQAKTGATGRLAKEGGCMMQAVPTLTPRIDAINRKLCNLYTSSAYHHAISQLVYEIEQAIEEYEEMVDV